MRQDDLEEFSKNYHADIAGTAQAYELLKEHAFVETTGEFLAEYGDIDDCVCCSYQAHGLKVDGYCFDEEFDHLTVVVSHWLDSSNISSIKVSDSEVNAVFNRCKNFVTKSMKGQLHSRIEISNEAHDLSQLIYECRNDIKNVKIIMVTDGITKSRPADTITIDDIDYTQIIWDIERTYHFLKTGERETINIDFDKDYGGALPCVTHKDETDKYTTYISFISGSLLADMYANWGTKLLDMNVRVFLSVREKVNRGIRDTILNEPEMFCAYNNGITAFAKELEINRMTNGNFGITNAYEFQIVNGGQTTASLYHARKKNRASLDNIYVQMKLTVIHNEDEIDALVPKISEYSNTQNKIQMADLLANDPPHPELHAISISTPAPDPTGGSKQTYWFYEKSRGSYEETRNMTALTIAQKKKYDSLRPKRQRFDKNKFGKVWNTYLMLPYTVSLGAQKNFARFNVWLREQLDEDWTAFFQKTVALVQLWNAAETIVRKQKFEGYRHNIVTYTLAWLFKLTESKIDLEKLWNEQKIGDSILENILAMCQIVNKHIRDTDKNVTEWCKKEECWKTLLEKQFNLGESINSEYISSNNKNKGYDSDIASEKEIIKFCQSKEANAWFKLSKWLKERNFLSGKARSQCFNMGRFISQGKKPSIALSRPCKKAWNDAEARGWIYDENVT